MSDTYEITASLTEPFYSGSIDTTEDRSLPVAIGTRAFLVDLASQQFSRRSVQLLNTQQAESGKDSSNMSPEVWRRSVESWHQGAAQGRYDRDDALPSRYKASSGIDPWTKYEFSLLPKADLLSILDAPGGAILRSIGRTLFVITDFEVMTYADAVGAVASMVSEPMSSPPIAAACDGEILYVLDYAGVLHSYTASTATWNHSVATVASFNPYKAMLAYVKGFLLIGNGPDLWDYTTPGTPVLVVTHRLAGWWWRSACEGLSVIYVLGGMGDRWHVNRVSIKNTGAGLDPPIVAATLPEGEFAYTIASYLGYVLIGVHNGWRFAIADSGGTLTYGQAIRTPYPVKCFEGQDRFVWFGLSAETVDSSNPGILREDIWGETAGIGRADLSTFVSAITPAAASDIASARYGAVTDIVTVGDDTDGIGYRAFVVSGATEDNTGVYGSGLYGSGDYGTGAGGSGGSGGVYIESVTEVVESGWLRQGYVSFNSTDKKMGLYGQVFHEALSGSITVEVEIDGSGSFTGIGENANPDSTTMGNMAFTQPFNTLEMKYTLTRGEDSTTGPVVKRSEFRALNIPGRATEWRIPLMLSETIQHLDFVRSTDVSSDYDYLMGLVQTRSPFTYREGDRNWTLHATDFLWQPDTLVSDGSTYQGTFILVAREIN
jgi:hypothetical protein